MMSENWELGDRPTCCGPAQDSSVVEWVMFVDDDGESVMGWGALDGYYDDRAERRVPVRYCPFCRCGLAALTYRKGQRVVRQESDPASARTGRM